LYSILRFFDSELQDNNIKIAPTGQSSTALPQQTKAGKLLHAQAGLGILIPQDPGNDVSGSPFCTELGE
jgi:hypothetical protein